MVIKPEKPENWYTRCLNPDDNPDDIIQEAGIKETIGSLVGAVALILYGFGLHDVSQRTQIPEQEIVEALQDDLTVNEARRMIQKETEENNPRRETPKGEEASNTINIVARTIYAEGLSESEEGKRAIATVIHNRGRGNPSAMVKAIQSHKQFSCWNSAEADDWTNMKQGKGRSWEDSQRIAQEMVNGTFSPVAAYDHYYNPKKANPYWAYKDKARTVLHPYVTIGNHRFFILGSWKT